MSPKTGRHLILEQFLADGLDHMFGNPGTVEQGFLDAVADYPEMHYVLTLQESVAVFAADGYARARRKPALVQIHSTPGLGNAIGSLYQAKRGHAPLVVIGGDAGVQYMNMDSQMAGDLVAMAAPVTKWSTMVTHPASLLRVLRRAIKTAATPPMGPVYVCLPMDVLDAPVTEEVIPTHIPSTRVVPEEQTVRETARALAGASKPLFFVGDGVAYSGAEQELARVAELVGAEVWEADAGEVNLSHRHPCYQGMTGHMFGSQSLPLMQRGDTVLICGTYVLPEVFPVLGSIFASDAKVIHIDLNAYEIAKNHRVDLGMVSDPKLTLGQLADELSGVMTPPQQEAARKRFDGMVRSRETRLQAALAADAKNAGGARLQMPQFMEQLAAQLPADTIVFDEALTNGPAVERYIQPERTGSYFLTRGGSLGAGFPGAIGAKLANPGRTVIGFSGDGGSMYTIQALWTAARHGLDVKFVVCNNGCYGLLQANISAYWKERGIPARDFPLSFDLSRPVIGFTDIARGLGIQAVRVEQAWEIGDGIRQALEHKGPFLIDLVLEGSTHPELIGVHCGQ